MSSQQIAAKLKFDIEEAKLKNSRRIKEAATLFTNTQEDVRLDQARTKLKLGKSLEDISAQIQKDREAGKNQPVQASGVAPPRNIPSSANGGGGGAGAVGELASAILGGDKNIQSSPQTATGPGPRPGTLTDTVTHEGPRNLSVRGIPFGQILGGLIQGAGNLLGSEGTANFGRAITTQKFETKSTREDPDFEQLKDDSSSNLAGVFEGVSNGTMEQSELPRAMNRVITAVGPREVQSIVQRASVDFQGRRQQTIKDESEKAGLFGEFAIKEGLFKRGPGAKEFNTAFMLAVKKSIKAKTIDERLDAAEALSGILQGSRSNRLQDAKQESQEDRKSVV